MAVLPNNCQSIAFGIGHRAQQHGIHQAEDRCVGSDTQRQRQDNHGTEPRAPHDSARGKAQVLHEILKEAYFTRLSALLFDLLQPAELAERGIQTARNPGGYRIRIPIGNGYDGERGFQESAERTRMRPVDGIARSCLTPPPF